MKMSCLRWAIFTSLNVTHPPAGILLASGRFWPRSRLTLLPVAWPTVALHSDTLFPGRIDHQASPSVAPNQSEWSLLPTIETTRLPPGNDVPGKQDEPSPSLDPTSLKGEKVWCFISESFIWRFYNNCKLLLSFQPEWLKQQQHE